MMKAIGKLLFNLLIRPTIVAVCTVVMMAAGLAVMAISGGSVFLTAVLIDRSLGLRGAFADFAMMPAMIAAASTVRAVFDVAPRYLTLRGNPSSPGIKKEEP
jgi:hypothetical protein